MDRDKIKKLKKQGKVFDEDSALFLIEKMQKEIKLLRKTIDYYKKRDKRRDVREARLMDRLGKLRKKSIKGLDGRKLRFIKTTLKRQGKRIENLEKKLKL